MAWTCGERWCKRPLHLHQSLSGLAQRIVMLGEAKADNPLVRRIPVKHRDWDYGHFVFASQAGSEFRVGLITDRTVIGQLEVSSARWNQAEI